MKPMANNTTLASTQGRNMKISDYTILGTKGILHYIPFQSSAIVDFSSHACCKLPRS